MGPDCLHKQNWILEEKFHCGVPQNFNTDSDFLLLCSFIISCLSAQDSYHGIFSFVSSAITPALSILGDYSFPYVTLLCPGFYLQFLLIYRLSGFSMQNKIGDEQNAL